VGAVSEKEKKLDEKKIEGEELSLEDLERVAGGSFAASFTANFATQGKTSDPPPSSSK
jgi:hypothetical protein